MRTIGPTDTKSGHYNSLVTRLVGIETALLAQT